ncbi:MAG: inositol monophosphatase family protein [Planctomycetota bacterium]
MAASLTEICARAVELAGEAGRLLLSHRQNLERLEVRIKSTPRDLVTEADLASERLLLEGLRASFPEHGIHAEESGRETHGAEWVWYVDPLDGTTNFVQGLPLFAVSLGLVRQEDPEVAVVHAPVLGETFTAVRGEGAWLGGRRLRVSTKSGLADSILATGFPYRRHLLLDNNLENFQRLFLRERGIRRMGSAAIDLAYVAAGRLDAFWELHLGPYDVAAGGLLVREAGGVVDTIVPGGDWIHGANLIAGPARLVEGLREVLLEERGRNYPPLGERRPQGA